MATKNEKYIAGAIIIAIVVIAGYTYMQGMWTLPFTIGGGGNNFVPSDQDKDNYKQGIGRYNVFETFVDSMDIGTVRTTVTNYVVKWYTKQGTLWTYKETGNNKYVTLTAADSGWLWVVVTIPSGQAYYVDYQKVLAGNDFVKGYLYADMDADGKKEFCFQYDMKNQPIPNSGYPAVSFNGFLLTYDASFTGLNNLSNATAIGGTTTTKFYDYYLAFASTKKGVGIYKVELKFGTTDETKCKLDKLNIPGIGYVDDSQFTTTTTASDIRYTYTITSSFDNALYVRYGANDNNRYDMTLSVEYTLASGDDILVTLTVYYLVAQTEAGTSTSDTFYAQYS